VSIVLYSLGALLSPFSWNYGSLLAFRLITAVGLGGEFGLGMSLFNVGERGVAERRERDLVEPLSAAGPSSAPGVAH
jgi:MFS family permease